MHFITADIEDYRSLILRNALGLVIPTSEYVDGEVEVLLDFLDEIETTATCFVVGRLALERPQVVRTIAERGHEIASHSHEHHLMAQHTPRTFARDLRTSLNVLEDIAGSRIFGFRAPAFSLKVGQEWAFEILAEHGIEYDSSVRLVWPFEAQRELLRAAATNGIREFPGIALGVGRLRIPLAGGGGLRLVPEWASRWGIQRARRAGFRVPVYIHPYDLNLNGPRQWPRASWNRRLRLQWTDWLQRRGRSRVRRRLSAAVRREPATMANAG